MVIYYVAPNLEVFENGMISEICSDFLLGFDVAIFMQYDSPVFCVSIQNYSRLCLPLLCATLSYCRNAGVHRPSLVHPSVKTVFSETVKRINYMYTISPHLFYFKILNFWFFKDFLFVLVSMGPYGSKHFKPHQWKYISHSLPPNHAYFWGGSLPKLCKELWNFKLWFFFFVFVNLGPYGTKVSNDISSEIIHQICCSKHCDFFFFFFFEKFIFSVTRC